MSWEVYHAYPLKNLDETSTCVHLPEDDFEAYLASHEYIFIFTTLLTILTIYLVICHSSPQMKGYKYILLIHVICFYFHDFQMGISTAIRSYSEVLGFGQMGLMSKLNVPVKYSLYISSCLITEVIGLYAHMFAYRTQAIIPPSSIFFLSKKVETCLTILFYNAWITGVIFTVICFSDDPEDILKQLQKYEICPEDYHYLLFTTDSIILLSNRILIMEIIIISGIFTFFICIFTCLLLCSYYLYNPNSQLSLKTRKLQKSLLIALCIQTFIPLIMMIIPALLLLHAPSLAVNKIAMVIYVQHGNANSIVLIIAHIDYRNTIYKAFRSLFISNAASARVSTLPSIIAPLK